MVPENSTFFCSTMATLLRRVSILYSRTSPPTRTQPRVTSYSRGISCTRVDFEEPVPPRMPTVCPDLMCRLMSLREKRFSSPE